jgi:UDP-glucose 4-epimerase
LAAGHNVVVVDNFSNSAPEVLERVRAVSGRPVEWIEADLRDRSAIQAILSSNPFDAILHFAGLKSAPRSVLDPASYWQVNVGGMANLLEAALVVGVGKFVFSSSAVVYGPQRVVPVAETAPVHPSNPYAHTKLAGEQMLREATKAYPAFRACSLRYFNPIGGHPSGLLGENSREPPENLFPRILAACRHGTTIDVYGTDYDTLDGSAIRDFIHVMDVAEGHCAALSYLARGADRGDERRSIFNLGTGKGCSVLGLIAAMERVSGKSIARRGRPRREGDIAVSVADVQRSADALGWRATRTIDDACKASLKWMEN